MKNSPLIFVALLMTLSSCVDSVVDPIVPEPVGFDYTIENDAVTIYALEGRGLIAYYAPQEFPVGCLNCDATYWDEYRVSNIVCNDKLPPFNLDDRTVIRVTSWMRGAKSVKDHDVIDEVFTIDQLKRAYK